MKFLFTLLFVFCISLDSNSANIPATTSFPNTNSEINTTIDPLAVIANLKIKTIEKMMGRKLKLKEKIALKIYQWKLKKGFYPAVAKARTKEERKKDKGTLAQTLGIIGLVAVFIPYVNIIAIPAAILALVFGYEARREDPGSRRARTAITLGWITVALFVVILAIAIAVLASLSFFG